MALAETDFLHVEALQGGPKSKPLPNYQELVLKPADESRFLCKIKLSIHYIIICW